MDKLNIKNIFVIEICIDEDLNDVIHMTGNNGKEPTQKEIYDLVLPDIRKKVHEKSNFEIVDIYTVEDSLSLNNQL